MKSKIINAWKIEQNDIKYDIFQMESGRVHVYAYYRNISYFFGYAYNTDCENDVIIVVDNNKKGPHIFRS